MAKGTTMLAESTEKRLEKLRLAVEKKYKSKARPTKQNNIVELVADHYGLAVEEVLSKDRPKDIYWARAVTYYLIQKKYGLTLRAIAKQVGCECSSKVYYSIQSVVARIVADPKVAEEIENLERELQ